MGVERMNCIPLLPTADTEFAPLPAPSGAMMHEVRAEASIYLPQMEHCSRCRSDAVGFLGQDRSAEFADELRQCASIPVGMDVSRPKVAVASWEGMLINQHLGEAQAFWIFERTHKGYEHVDTREAPAAGGGDDRWTALANSLADCRCVLVNGVGARPRAVLEQHGIAVLEVEGVIEEGLAAVYETHDYSRLLVRKKKACQVGCTGTGGGCG
jgi:nitrogen fixation protein NifB